MKELNVYKSLFSNSQYVVDIMFSKSSNWSSTSNLFIEVSSRLDAVVMSAGGNYCVSILESFWMPIKGMLGENLNIILSLL